MKQNNLPSITPEQRLEMQEKAKLTREAKKLAGEALKQDLIGENYINKEFGLLTAISEPYHIERSGTLRKVLDLLCSCGEILIATRFDTLINCKPMKSCGCQSRSSAAKSHGMSRTKEYKAWQAIKQRCLNKKAKRYEYYGGSGIQVWDLWINNFEEFFNHIGRAPSEEYSVDRIDNNKGYEPGNVRWATQSEQQRNRGRFKRSTTGVTGVCMVTTKHGTKYIAHCKKLNGKAWSKSFSESVYGSNAFSMACDYREYMISELNKEGAGYTEGSGK